MIRKLFIAICAGVVSLAASAQLVISPTGLMNEIAFQAENMSPDGTGYACGSNYLNEQAAIWNIATGEIMEYGSVDSIYPPIYAEDSITILGYDSTERVEVFLGGTFHAINNDGLAVGEYGREGNAYPAKVQFGSNEISYLYSNREVDAGGGSWAVSSDGQIILGFYFDEGWNTRACIWRNGGMHSRDRINLPAPTEEEFGGPIDYVAARWMNDDASVILGYVEDGITGSWVMIYWTLELDGYYKVHAEHAKRYFTPYDYDGSGNAYYVKPNNPYAWFEPNAISANGEWISLTVTEQIDLNDFAATETKKAARLNIKTDVLEVLDLGNYDAPIMYGIADNGTCAGANEPGGFGPMAPARGAGLSQNRNGYVWFANSDTIYSLQDMYPTEPYFNYSEGDAVISTISSNGTKILGFTNQLSGEDWVISSYVATLPTMAVEHVEDAVKGVKMIKNGQVVIVREGKRYNIKGVRL